MTPASLASEAASNHAPRHRIARTPGVLDSRSRRSSNLGLAGSRRSRCIFGVGELLFSVYTECPLGGEPLAGSLNIDADERLMDGLRMLQLWS